MGSGQGDGDVKTLKVKIIIAKYSKNKSMTYRIVSHAFYIMRY